MDMFILPEEFLKANDKVQEELQDWWIEMFKSEPTGLTPFSFNGQIMIYTETTKPDFFHPEDCIPIYTETLMRYYIEDRMSARVDISYNVNSDTYKFELISMKDGAIIQTYRDMPQDLVNSYWEITKDVAKIIIEKYSKEKNPTIESYNDNHLETIFQAFYHINGRDEYSHRRYQPKNHVFTSTVTAKNLKEAEANFIEWFKGQNIEYEFIEIKDFKNGIVKNFK